MLGVVRGVHVHNAFLCGCVWGQNCLAKGFHYSKEYASKFEPLKDFFAENETLNLEALAKEDHGNVPLSTSPAWHHY